MSDSSLMNGEHGLKKVTSLLPTNGGNRSYSYYENSYYQGLIKESQVDSFNVPIYQSASPDTRDLVERNGYFSIKWLELSKASLWLKGSIDVLAWMMHARATMKGSFIKHFGINEVADQVFKRLTKKLVEHLELLRKWCNQEVQLFVVLKRKKII